MNILVVDDEKTVSDALKMLLKHLGHSVDVLDDVEEALSKLRKQPDHYHILITDHLMPKISGLELLEQLPRNTFKGEVIVISGYLTPEIEAKYRELGVATILQKPFKVGELRQAVEEMRPAAAA